MRPTLPFGSRLSLDTDMGSGELGVLVVGGFLGGALGGFVMWVFGSAALVLLGMLFGLQSLGGGWLAMLAVSVLMTVPFAMFVSGSINGFVNRVIMLSRESPALQKVLVPMLNRSAMTTTTVALGTLFGLALGAIAYLVLVPIRLAVAGMASVSLTDLVLTTVVGIVAFVVYGAVLGVVYGMLLES